MDDQRVLGGRYLLKDKVGTGGMASVYRAQDQVLDRTVAVKIMLPQYAGDATFAARFKQEAQAAAGLSSPYIVGVYDWGKDGDTYYIVMEYLRGTDLKSGVRSHGALDPKKVAQIGSQICGALSVAHKHEIIHRDIKPQNIMVLPDGNIKVMDFGIARAKNSHLTQDNNVLGTAHYVSPEQTRGQELGPTSDIYSLGVVMYECATGRVPFDGDDAISVALKQVNELPVPPSQVNPGIDPDLERIILRCMEKDAANRFQSADELRQVLNSYIAGRSVDVPEPTRVIGTPAGENTTRVMGDKTQAMVRPNLAGQTTARGGVAAGGRGSSASSYQPEPEKKGMSGGKVAGIVVGVIAVLAIAAFAFMSLMGGDEGIAVPNVIGLAQEEAVSQIKGAGFAVKTDQQYSDSVAEGTVMDQTPKSGEKRSKGSAVTIVISRGAEPVQEVSVPDLTGMTQSQADKTLSAVNLKGQATEEENDEADEGEVFWQDTAAGEKVAEGSTISYKVAKGASSVSVPGVLGMSYSKASNALSEAGFKVVDGGEDYSDTYDEGTVMSQSVTGTAKKGSEVELVVSKGPKSGSASSDSVDVDALGLKGMDVDDASQALAYVGMQYDYSQTQSSTTVPEGCVISYSPSGKQKKGTVIFLVVSTGSGGSGTDTASAR